MSMYRKIDFRQDFVPKVQPNKVVYYNIVDDATRAIISMLWFIYCFSLISNYDHKDLVLPAYYIVKTEEQHETELFIHNVMVVNI